MQYVPFEQKQKTDKYEIYAPILEFLGCFMTSSLTSVIGDSIIIGSDSITY